MSETYQQNIRSDRFDPMQDSYDTVRLRLDPSPFLLIIRCNLLRHKYNEHTKKWEKVVGQKPLFDDAGIDDLMTELEARLTIYGELSLLTEPKVNQIVREMGEICFEFIFFRKDVYNINVEDYRRIVHLITHNVDIFLRRALGGQENKLLSKQFTYSEASNVTQNMPTQQQSKGFSFMKGSGGYSK